MEAHGSDLNPLAVTIQHMLIEWPQNFAHAPAVHPRNKAKMSDGGAFSGLASDVTAYAEDINAELRRRLKDVYPPVKDSHGKEIEPGVYLWARSVPCPNPTCGAITPLVKEWRLSIRSGAHVRPKIDPIKRSINFEVHFEGAPPEPSFRGRKGGNCLVCSTPIDYIWVREQGSANKITSRLMAIAAGDGYAWTFHQPTQEQEVTALGVPAAQWEPRGLVPHGSIPRNVQPYGMETWSSLYTSRQMLALTTLHNIVKEFERTMIADAETAGMLVGGEGVANGGQGARAYAQLLRTYLHLTGSNLADWSCSMLDWNPSIPAMGHLFSRPAIQMKWSYAEGSLFGKGGANFLQKVARTVEVINRTPANPNGSSKQADATKIRWAGNNRPLVITDPPYYDIISYAEIADFFYVWLRECMKDIDPETFATISCPKAEELIMARDRHGGDEERAKQFFESGLTQALHHLRSFSNPDLPLSIYYAYNDTDQSEDGEGNEETGSSGWETILQSIVDAGLQIVMTYPLRSEASGRATSNNASALAACILMVCRPRPENAPVGTRGDFALGLKSELGMAIERLKDGDLGALDLSQAAIGPGMAIFTRYAKVLESDGRKMTMRTALDLINKGVSDAVGTNDALFDSQTRWCIRWFEQNRFGAAPYGDAQMLANANGLNVPDLERSGVITSKAGQVQLLVGDSLPVEWDPRVDTRITTWEVLHHLLACLLPKGSPGGRAVGGSEGEALALAALLSPNLLDQAKELAYRMFDICRVRGWDTEALAYNAIGQSWGDLKSAVGRSGAQMKLDMGDR
jgi:putative DNA methylase